MSPRIPIDQSVIDRFERAPAPPVACDPEHAPIVPVGMGLVVFPMRQRRMYQNDTHVVWRDHDGRVWVPVTGPIPEGSR